MFSGLLLCFTVITFSETKAQNITPEDTSKFDSSSSFELGKITVTGKRKQQSFDRIDAPSMNRENKTDVSKALSILPGLAAVNVGARNEANIYIRGFNSLQATMFLDGIPVYVPYDGNIDLSRFTTFDISEITVEKGAVSPMYGVNTMGGVINVITRKPSAPIDISVKTGLKSGDGYLGTVSIGTRHKRFYGTGAYSYVERDHYTLSNDFSPSKYQTKSERDNSYNRDWKMSIKVGFEDSAIGEFSLSAASQNGKKGTPVYAGTDSALLATARFWRWPYYDKTNVYAISKLNIGRIGYIKIPLYYDRFCNSLCIYDDTTYATFKKRSSSRSSYDDHSIGGSTEFVTSLIPNDSLKIAVQYKSDYHNESNTSNDTAKSLSREVFIKKPDISFSDYTVSLAIENSLRLFDRLTLVPSASFSLRKASKAQNLTEPKPYQYLVTEFPLSKDTGWSLQLATFFNINKNNTVNASISRRTRFPSIKDRYSYRLGLGIPNPDLNPENAIQGELGFMGKPVDNLYLQCAIWGAELDDVIQQISKIGPNGESQNQNAGEARFYGYEAGAKYMIMEDLPAFDHLSISFTRSYTKRRNITNPLILFTDIPEYKDVISIDYSPVKPLTLTWSHIWESQRFSSSDGKRVAPAYTADDVHANCTYHNVTLNAGINNVFDINYSLLEGYPEQGRNYYVNLSFDFKK